MELTASSVFLKTQIMKKLLTLLSLSILIATGKLPAQNTFGEIRGQVLDSADNTPLPFANVLLIENERIIAGAQTDPDGYFSIKPVNPGNVELRLDVMGYNRSILSDVKVNPGRMTYVQFKASQQTMGLPITVIETFRNPLIDRGQISTMQVLEEEDIASAPYMDVKQMAANTAGVYQEEGEGGSLFMRGARENATAYYIDGVRVIGDFRLPKNAVKEIKVLTGGIPASVGDVSGGVIMITTKGYANF